MSKHIELLERWSHSTKKPFFLDKNSCYWGCKRKRENLESFCIFCQDDKSQIYCISIHASYHKTCYIYLGICESCAYAHTGRYKSFYVSEEYPILYYQIFSSEFQPSQSEKVAFRVIFETAVKVSSPERLELILNCFSIVFGDENLKQVFDSQLLVEIDNKLSTMST